MTELTLAGRQNGRFHETRVPNAEVRWLIDEWYDALQLLTAAVADELCIPTPLQQLQALSAPTEFIPKNMNDPRSLLGPVFDYLHNEGLADPAAARARSAEALDGAFGQDVYRMREWWREGYFARIGTIVLEDKHYRIYNHQPAFAFTGDIHRAQLRNARTGNLEWWLHADLDTEPLLDNNGDFVPANPDMPVTILPAMSHERRVTRALANAHLNALRSSLASWVIEEYAPNLHGMPEPEPESRPINRILARLAVLAPEEIR